MAWKFEGPFIAGVSAWTVEQANNAFEGLKELFERWNTAAKPTVGANGTVTLGSAYKRTNMIGNLVHDGTKTTFKVSHNLKGLFPQVVVYTSTGVAPNQKPGEITTVSKIVVNTENDIEIVFSVAQAAGTVFWFMIEAP